MGSREARRKFITRASTSVILIIPWWFFFAVIHMVANSSLRPGNSHTADNALTFLDDNLDKPAGKQVLLLRGQIIVWVIVHWSLRWIYLKLSFGVYLYRGRADCENHIKEFKYNFGRESFNLRDFWATEVALMTVILACNLMGLFRQAGLWSDRVSGKPDVQHPLKPYVSSTSLTG